MTVLKVSIFQKKKAFVLNVTQTLEWASMGTSTAFDTKGRKLVVTAIGVNDEPAGVKAQMSSFIPTSEPSHNRNATSLPPSMPSSPLPSSQPNIDPTTSPPSTKTSSNATSLPSSMPNF